MIKLFLSNIKNKIMLILALIMIFLCIVLFIFIKKYRNTKLELEDTKIELQVKTSEVVHLKDKNGVYYARVLEYSKTNKELKNSNDSIEKKMYSQARLNDLSKRQIKKLQYALMESRDSLKSSLKDSIVIIRGIKYDKYAAFKNNNLDANIYIQSDSCDAQLDYKYTVELYMTDSWTKPRFFLWRWFGFKGRNQQFDFKTSDPNATVKVLRSISVSK